MLGTLLDRRHVRRPVRVSIRVRDAENPTEGEVLFDALDISQGGAFLQSDLLLEIGAELEVTFAIPGEIRPIRAHARVAWATRTASAKGSAGMGLEFVDLNEADRKLIADFVRSVRDA
jgi:uncharacterized protein (TIGR02266 family)